jgi:hypothetical protein
VKSSDAQQAQDLHYAPPPPVHRRRLLARSLIAMGVFLALLLSARWGPPLWRRTTLLYWQRQCMFAPLRSGLVIFAEPATEQNGWNSIPRAVAVDRAWERFDNHFASSPRSKACGSIFLHEMRSPAGHRRLVALNVYSTFAPFRISVCVAQVFQPGGLLSDPREVISNQLSWFGAEHASRITGASADSTDPSHFSFQFDERIYSAQRTRIVDGWLTDDDRIILEVRENPVTPPAPPSPASPP